jgi:hydrogenase maturation protease
LLAAVGSEWRRDDGIGRVVVRRVRELVLATALGCSNLEVLDELADPLDLLGRWDGADMAVLVDATRSGCEPGTLRRVEMGSSPVGGGQTSTHAIGIAGALRLALALGSAPRRVVVVGVEGADFHHGKGLSPEVSAAVEGAAREVMEILNGRLEREEVSPCA